MDINTKVSRNKDLHKKLRIQYQSYVSYWKDSSNYKKEFQEPYFAIYCNLGKLLSSISNDALKIYLYIGFNINYKKGFLIKNNDRICKDIYFKKNKIDKCLKELESKNLIYITKDTNDNDYIFITPYEFNNTYEYSIIELEKVYKAWIKNCKESKEPFFIVYKKFMDYWCFLSSGSIKLYIYFGIYMDKKKGFFYRGLDRISNDLNVSKRSVSKWFNELQERNLVKRQQLFINRASSTYLIPLIDINKYNDKNEFMTNTNSINFNSFSTQYSNDNLSLRSFEENEEFNQGF